MGILADAVTLCTGFGSVKIVYGSTTTRGLWDDVESAEDMGNGTTVLVRRRGLRVATAQLPTVAAEDTIRVGGVEDDATLTTYRVVDVQKEGDGVITVIQVAG